MPHHVPISSFHKWNIDMLMEEIWNYLKMMRIYTKPKGQIPDYEEVTLKKKNEKKMHTHTHV
jgi:uncharacterized protein